MFVIYKVIKPFLKLAFLTTVFLGLGEIYAQNLVANGNFSANGTGWTFFAPGTQIEATYNETVYGGTIASNIVSEIDNWADLRRTNIAVIPGAIYHLSFRHARRVGTQTPNPVSISVKVYDGANVYLNQNISSTSTTWLWECENYLFTPTSNTISLDIRDFNNAATYGMIIDDITITPQEQVINMVGITCQGGAFTLSAPITTDPNATYANYSWTGPNGFTGNTQSVTLQNIQPNQSGAYTCTMTLNGCLTVSGSVDVQVTPSDFYLTKSICNGNTYDFYGRILYSSGSYDTLILNNAGGCDSFIHLNLTVDPLPDVAINPNEKVEICRGDSMKFSIVNLDADNTYQWIKDGSAIAGEQGLSYLAGEMGEYCFSAVTSKGCKDTSGIIKLDVFEKPVAQILPIPDNDFCNNDTVRLKAYSESDVFYFWEPGNVFRAIGVTTDQQEVSGRFTEPFTDVILTVMNIHGCYASDKAQILTHECCYLFVPNAFTPNGDLLNDKFLPEMRAGQLVVSMRIFDRWGKQVYDYKSNKKGWNGFYPDGASASSGVYGYYIEYTCGAEKVLSRKGDITLIR